MNKVKATGLFLSILLKLIIKTIRFRLIDQSNNPTWRNKKAKIIVFWHGQQLLMPYVYLYQKSPKNVYALISKHKDGRIAAEVMNRLGLKSIAGSSTEGGLKAFKQMAKKIKSGQHVAITPDGPQGPVREVKDGAIKLASVTGAEIVPFSLTASNKWTFNSWDSMFLPKPFSKVLAIIGEPVKIPGNLNENETNEAKESLRIYLNQLESEAEKQLKDK